MRPAVCLYIANMLQAPKELRVSNRRGSDIQHALFDAFADRL